MNSMTGYGKAVVAKQGRELCVELKSVNHRFLDISTKIPRMFISCEDIIRNGLSEGLSRGHVDVYLNYTVTEDVAKTIDVDYALAEGYINAASNLKERFGLNDDFTLTSLMRTPDVLQVRREEESEEILREMLGEGIAKAVEALNAMRRSEGGKLCRDISSRIDTIEQLLGRIREFAPKVVTDYRNKLQQRIQEVLEGVEVDQAKLLNEVAFFTDKSNIDEEITRLDSHIAHARQLLSDEHPTGRKLDFLIQEFNREANTICSKSNNAQLTDIALALKNEIEKVREQVQNLE